MQIKRLLLRSLGSLSGSAHNYPGLYAGMQTETTAITMKDMQCMKNRHFSVAFPFFYFMAFMLFMVKSL